MPTVRPCKKIIHPFCRGPTCGKCVREQWRSRNNAPFALIRRGWGQHWPRWNGSGAGFGFWRIAFADLLGRFSNSSGFEPFFVFYCDTKLRLTPRTHPHKNLFFCHVECFCHAVGSIQAADLTRSDACDVSLHDEWSGCFQPGPAPGTYRY